MENMTGRQKIVTVITIAFVNYIFMSMVARRQMEKKWKEQRALEAALLFERNQRAYEDAMKPMAGRPYDVHVLGENRG